MIRGSRAVTSCIWIPCSLAAVMGTPGSLRGAQVRGAGLIPPAATRSSNDSAGRGPRAARLAGWAGAADNADQAGPWELSWRACLRYLNPWWCQTRRLSKWGEEKSDSMNKYKYLALLCSLYLLISLPSDSNRDCWWHIFSAFSDELLVMRISGFPYIPVLLSPSETGISMGKYQVLVQTVIQKVKASCAVSYFLIRWKLLYLARFLLDTPESERCSRLLPWNCALDRSPLWNNVEQEPWGWSKMCWRDVLRSGWLVLATALSECSKAQFLCRNQVGTGQHYQSQLPVTPRSASCQLPVYSLYGGNKCCLSLN